MPWMIDKGWLINHASLMKLTSAIATISADVFILAKTAPFTLFLTYDTIDLLYSVPINNIMWQINMDIFRKNILFYIWFKTYWVKVYLLGNYLPNLWVINLEIWMKIKEIRASWWSFIRWIVSIYSKFFANKYFRKRDTIFWKI